jgi:hypothetical protein
MTDVATELQVASDGAQLRDRVEAGNSDPPNDLADAAEEADLASERTREPLAGPPPGITKGIVYW